MKRFGRRTLLRGTLAGGAVSVGVPLLDCFLNDNGTALAQGGALPLRFGAWTWGCGLNPGRWIPNTVGTGYDLPPELEALDREFANGQKARESVSVLSGFDVKPNGQPSHPHFSGIAAILTGLVPEEAFQYTLPTIDSVIASQIGTTTRFRSIETTCTGFSFLSYSFEANTVPNAPEISPLALFTRVFGPDFADPADDNFTPDPMWMLRQSVLSAVKDDRDALMKVAGTHDRQRLDQYFTSVRQLETQLDVLLAGPPDLASCVKPPEPVGENVGFEVEQSKRTNRLMAELLALTLACDQTRVFSQMFSYQQSGLRLPGVAPSHHQLTHDEAVDPSLGYQPQSTVFVLESMEAWVDFLERLAAIPEGDGTLLDNCLVLAHSDVSFAKDHLITGIPMMIAGGASGRINPGLHIAGGGSITSRVGLTVQQAMGLSVDKWGVDSMETSDPVSELLT